MPFETLESLPDRIKKMPTAQQEVWRGAWNGRFKACQDDGGTERECESSAFAVANAAVKKELAPDDGAKFIDDMIYYGDIYRAQLTQDQARYDPIGARGDRACSNCRWYVAPNACIIIASFPDPIVSNGLSNRWELRIPFQSDPLPVVVVEDATEEFQIGVVGEQTASRREEAKATKTEGGVEYPASDYAVVPDGEKPSGWKLRLAEGSAGNQTVAQVGRAITALQPGGFRGQEVQLTSEQRTGAISKIGGAIGRISGATAEQKTSLRERLDGVKSKTLKVSGPERLLKGIRERLNLILSPEVEAPGPFMLFKEEGGDIRWFAWMSNHWRDRDNPPEILEQKAHQDYVEYVDRTGHFPEAWLWHTPGSKWGQADWVDFADGFLMVSGTVDVGKEHVADALALQKDLGVSHGFRYGHSDAKDGIIGWYRTFEVSPLPIEVAANPWTSLEVLQKELDMGFSNAKRAFLVGHLGEGEVARLESDTGALKAALEKAGVEWKDVPEDAETPLGDAATAEAFAQKAGEIAAAGVLASEAFTGLTAAIKGLGDRLTDLEKTEDEKIAAAIGGQSHRTAGYRASGAQDNVVSKEEAAKEEAFQGPTIMDQVMEGLELQVPVE